MEMLTLGTIVWFFGNTSLAKIFKDDGSFAGKFFKGEIVGIRQTINGVLYDIKDEKFFERDVPATIVSTDLNVIANNMKEAIDQAVKRH